MNARRTWPTDWEAQRAGAGCGKCGQGRPDEDQWGVRWFAGAHADAYLQRTCPQAGSVLARRLRRHPQHHRWSRMKLHPVGAVVGAPPQFGYRADRERDRRPLRPPDSTDTYAGGPGPVGP